MAFKVGTANVTMRSDDETGRGEFLLFHPSWNITDSVTPDPVVDENGNRVRPTGPVATLVAKLTNAATPSFGESVAVGAGKVVIGAPADRAAFIYDKAGTQEVQLSPSQDIANEDSYGFNVGVSSGRIIVTGHKATVPANVLNDLLGGLGGLLGGAEEEAVEGGMVYSYDLSGELIGQFVGSVSNENFGIRLGVGNGVAAFAYNDQDTNSGSVKLLDKNLANEIATIDSATGANIGSAVDIGVNRLVIQDDSDSTTKVYDLNGTNLGITPTIMATPDPAVESLGIVGIGSNTILVGDPTATVDGVTNAGKVVAYASDTGAQLYELMAPTPVQDAKFGKCCKIGGGYTAVGAPGEQVVYVFDIVNHLVQRLEGDTPGEGYGYNLSIGSDQLIVATTAGAAYLYDLPKTLYSYYERVIEGK